MTTTLASTIVHTSTPMAVLAVVALALWAIVHIFTKKLEEAPWTQVHTILSIVATSSIMLMLVGRLGKI